MLLTPILVRFIKWQPCLIPFSVSQTKFKTHVWCQIELIGRILIDNTMRWQHHLIAS